MRSSEKENQGKRNTNKEVNIRHKCVLIEESRKRMEQLAGPLPIQLSGKYPFIPLLEA